MPTALDGPRGLKFAQVHCLIALVVAGIVNAYVLIILQE